VIERNEYEFLHVKEVYRRSGTVVDEVIKIRGNICFLIGHVLEYLFTVFKFQFTDIIIILEKNGLFQY